MKNEIAQKHLVDQVASSSDIGDHIIDHPEAPPKQHKVCSQAQAGVPDRLIEQTDQPFESGQVSVQDSPDPFVNDGSEDLHVDGLALGKPTEYS